MENISRRNFFGLAASAAVLAPSIVNARDIIVYDYNCTRPLLTQPFKEFRERLRKNQIFRRPAAPKPLGRRRLLQRGKRKPQHINCPRHKQKPGRARLGVTHRDRIIHVCVDGGGVGGGQGVGPGGEKGFGGGFGNGGNVSGGGWWHNPFSDLGGEIGGWWEQPPSIGNGGGPCFLTGRVLLADGTEKPVADVAVGDMLHCRFGGAQRVAEVIRTEHRSRWWGWPRTSQPVLVRQDAIAPGVPYEDVLLTGSHALWVRYDDRFHLVTAATLVNGTTIVRQKPKGGVFHTYHFRLAGRHDVIYASGLPAESFSTMPFQPVLSRTGRWRQPFLKWLLRHGLRKPRDTVDAIHLAFAAT